MKEFWKPIAGFSRYEISTLGRVRNTVTGRILKSNPNTSGKYFTRLPPDTGLRPVNCYIGQLVLAAFIGPKPQGYEVSYLDGSNANNVLTNLAYETHAQNAHRKPYNSGTPRVTSAETKERIAKMFAGGLSLNAIRNSTGLSRSTVQLLTGGRGTVAKKLNASKVAVIKMRLAQGEKMTKVGADFGVTYNCIQQIKNGRIWSSVE